MKRVAIMGLGLMGGSLGLALKARGFEGAVAGYARRPETRDLALKMRAVDEAFDEPGDAVQEADLAVFCAPILAIPEMVASVRTRFKQPCIVTDVGSTKASLAARIEPSLENTGAVYVGSHPIAGSEQQGLESARADLYENAVVVITPATAEADAVESLSTFWQNVGSIVRILTPEEHDRIMARTSHLPHIMSVLIASTVGRSGGSGNLGMYCGSGFRDSTRIAEGSPEVWRDIIQSNQQFILDELKAVGTDLERMTGLVMRGDFEGVKAFLSEGRARRRALMQGRTGDEPGGNSI